MIRLLPLLTIYFIAGLDSFSSVTFTFLKQNFFQLTAEQWAGLAIFSGLPWSIKIIYATFIDGLPIFGSNRRAYILLGSALMALGNLLMIDILSWDILYNLSTYTRVGLDFFLVSSGIVIADIVADTMAVDVVEKDDNYAENLGKVGVYSRIAMMIGGLIGAFSTGWLAKYLDPIYVMWLWMICPLIIIVSCSFLPIPEPKKPGKLDKNLLYSGIIYFIAFVITILSTSSQLPIFIISLLYILYLAKDFLPEIPEKARKHFIFACLAIFCFRVIPAPAEPVQWWMIGELGLDQIFFGNLRIIATLAGIAALAVGKKWVTRGDIGTMLIIFTIADLIISLPTIMVYYGWTFGFQPGTLLMTEAALSSPLGNMAMIPLHILLAQYAPEKQRAVYIATTAAFVNLALLLGSLITKGLNSIYVVTQADFTQLGNLLISSLLISVIFSIVGIVMMRWKWKK
jgi:hypothetical protein